MNDIDPITIAQRMAVILANDATIEPYYPLIFRESLGALSGSDPRTLNDFLAKLKRKSLCPYIVIGAMQHDDGPVSEGDEIEVGILAALDASRDAYGNRVNTAEPMLNETTGIYETGAPDSLKQFVADIKAALVGSDVGGIITTFSTTYNAGEQYPVQFASINVSCRSVAAF